MAMFPQFGAMPGAPPASGGGAAVSLWWVGHSSRRLRAAVCYVECDALEISADLTDSAPRVFALRFVVFITDERVECGLKFFSFLAVAVDRDTHGDETAV